MASNVKRYLWTKKHGPFGKELPVSEAPTPDGTSGYSNLTGSKQREVPRWTNVGGPISIGGRPIYSRSEVPISRINTEGVVKIIRLISNFPTDHDSEGSEDFEVVISSAGHQYGTPPSQPSSKIFQSKIVPSTPRNFQPFLSTIPSPIPPLSTSPSTARPSLVPIVKSSPIPQPRNSPMITSQQLQPVVSSIRRRED
ncbi:hypothetical protein O181_106341 [Austropuccinia psidii MF-1]|uniref:Uncharacterized protein n=1 Tax=Austropuccinia psidii MF-1 TaxID=1389203 RepID=A0A9Q3JQU2_9BASI|nr:hypothetical protein [Austropuccinia psidii MF-1]